MWIQQYLVILTTNMLCSRMKIWRYVESMSWILTLKRYIEVLGEPRIHQGKPAMKSEKYIPVLHGKHMILSCMGNTWYCLKKRDKAIRSSPLRNSWLISHCNRTELLDGRPILTCEGKKRMIILRYCTNKTDIVKKMAIALFNYCKRLATVTILTGRLASWKFWAGKMSVMKWV